MSTILTSRTMLALVLAPCGRCGRLCAPCALEPTIYAGPWRCADLSACNAHRAEHARIAAALREGRAA